MGDFIAESEPHTCPEQIAIDAGLAGVEKYRAIQEEPERSIGALGVHQFFLSKVREAYPCPGAQIDQNGQLVCPLNNIVQRAQSAATAPWPTTSFNLPLSKIDKSGAAAVPSEAGTGQYL